MARLGDGKFNLALGKKKICYQENSKELMRRMQEILKNPNGKCLVCIPPRPVSAGFFVNILQDIHGFRIHMFTHD